MLIVPYEIARSEIVVVNSRFIASLSPADSVEAARSFIESARREFRDASHNVPAFIVGGGTSVTEYCSDDGEPSGTSGRPLLATLKGSGLGNVVVVVARYFGGTLLGTGGLVKAYSEAGRAVLSIVKRARLVETRRVSFSVPYRLFDRVKMAIDGTGGTIVSEDFAEEVTLDVDVEEACIAAFSAMLSDISSGGVALRTEPARLASIPL